MRVLVVEDDTKVASFLRKGLKSEGYAVDIAPDGEKASELAVGEPYDAIVLDIGLPGKDGYTVLTELRQQKQRTPVLLLTARDGVEDRVRGLDLGADDYLSKPFAFAELTARLRALLRRGAPEPEAILQVADLTLDPARHEVKRGGRLIDLTPKEFSLLEYLMRNAGRPVTRAMISEHVWDMNFDSFSNVIDVHINLIRKKIDADCHVKLVQTVRGVGYVIRET